MGKLRSIASRLLPLVIFCTSLADLECKKESPVGSNLPTSPGLTDPIPFDRLGEGKLVFERIGPFSNNYSGLYVVDIAQRRSWGISGGLNGPAVSPDGRKIAYTAVTSFQTSFDVYIVDIDGTNRQRVSDIVDMERSPSWMLDSKQILFHELSSNHPPIYPLYCQSPVSNPTDRRVLVDFGNIDPPNVFFVEGPVSASSTRKLVASAYGIRTMNADGSNIKLVIPRPTLYEFPYSPAWSPDGQTIAVLWLVRDSTKIVSIAVVLYAVEATNPDTLVALPASGVGEWAGDNSYSLCWSPDGSQIACTRPDGKDL